MEKEETIQEKEIREEKEKEEREKALALEQEGEDIVIDMPFTD